MLSNNKRVAIAAVIMALPGGGALMAQPRQPAAMVADGPALLGAPFTVNGTSYTPADPVYYDEVGYAGVMADGSQSGATATGEVFAASAITAAHKTLPLPSYVEVTALDSGKTILVRVNDRGPMRNDQLIALSPGAIAQLGVSDQGPVAVRVRRVNPPEQERAALRGQGRAAERLETPANVLKVLRGKLPAVRPSAPASAAIKAKAPATPAKSAAPAKPIATTRPGADFDQPASAKTSKPAPPAAKPALPPKSPAPKPTATAPSPAPSRKGGYVVQVGAFSAQARAEAAAKNVGGRVEAAGNLWRVRLGPYPTQQAAQAGVRSAAAKGFENARIMANDAQ
ncbi:RlpA-like double-psi beta-barrel domain-containing protein [Sphingobium rhizovicinum]|uniref:Endolytic peptidoglycan transglycosylase RlpA n=1 Tax=Sphingobium rhizovicinum TaxID=432308 RepID=A0ABV7NGI6_9SPHN